MVTSRRFGSTNWDPAMRDRRAADYICAIRVCGRKGATVESVARYLNLSEVRVKKTLDIMVGSLHMAKRVEDRYFEVD